MFAKLRTLVALRQACLQSRTAETNRIKSLARRMVGWSPNAEPLKRKAFCELATTVANAARKGGAVPTEHEAAVFALMPFGAMTEERVGALNAYIRELEKAIAALVEPLPIWTEWGAHVRGLGVPTVGTPSPRTWAPHSVQIGRGSTSAAMAFSSSRM